MPSTRRNLLLIPVMLMLASVAGCASTQSREFVRELTPMIGRADKAYFIEKYGEPDKRSMPDAQTEMWEYSFARTRLAETGAGANLSTTTVLRVTFKNGTFSSWQTTNRMN